MEFRLTYEGQLLAHRDDRRLVERALHVHAIRKQFHRQLTTLWQTHPALKAVASRDWNKPSIFQILKHDGFDWIPIVSDGNGLICKLEVLMLRHGPPGDVMHDIDNRLKTLFDALRKAKSPTELGSQSRAGQQTPEAHETPFYVLLEDDRLITHVAVTTDQLLQPVPGVLLPEEAVRLVINVTVSPYRMMMANVIFA